MTEQLSLFGAVDFRQRRVHETPFVYAAVCELREMGFAVTRAGHNHSVDGRTLTTREMLRLVRAKVGDRTMAFLRTGTYPE